MIDTNTHKIGDLVCFVKEKENIIGTITDIYGNFYHVDWNSSIYTNMGSSSHLKGAIFEMKQNLKRLYDAER